MSGKEDSSSASRHDSQTGLPGSGGRRDGPPPPFAPAAPPTTPLADDVTPPVVSASAGMGRTRSPGREVALPLPLAESTRETTVETTLSHLGSSGKPSSAHSKKTSSHH